jgi:hypothetical protein
MTRCAETDSQQPHAPDLARRYWELSLMSSDVVIISLAGSPDPRQRSRRERG